MSSIDQILDDLESEEAEQVNDENAEKDLDPLGESHSGRVTLDTESDEFIDFISSPFGFCTTVIDVQSKVEGEEFEWTLPQQLWLKSQGQSKIMNKCRQMGGSYVVAAEQYAIANLINQDYAFIFFSIKKDEAQNKISYIKEFIHNTPKQYRRKILYETKQSIELLNDDGSTCKIISHAQKPSRGLHGNMIYDEADFYNDFLELFEAGMPGTKKVGGTTSIISTPQDPEGLFRKILEGGEEIDPATGEMIPAYPEYHRFVFKWWDVPFYCTNIPEAQKKAPHMDVRERVYKYGTKILLSAFNDSPSIESFQQEYECFFFDENLKFFNTRRIKNCITRPYEEIYDQDYSLHWNQEVDPRVVELDTQISLSRIEKRLIDQGVSLRMYGEPSTPDSIKELQRAVHNGDIRYPLVAGLDIGTSGHGTDLCIFEEVNLNGKIFLVQRFWLHKRDWELPDQQEYLWEEVLQKIPLRKFGLDSNGIGKHLAQALKKKSPRVVKGVPILQKQLSDCLFSLKEFVDSEQITINNYRENIKGFSEVRGGGDYTAGGSNSWRLPKHETSHCDNVISAGIAALLTKQKYRDIGSNISLSASKTGDIIERKERLNYHEFISNTPKNRSNAKRFLQVKEEMVSNFRNEKRGSLKNNKPKGSFL